MGYPRHKNPAVIIAKLFPTGTGTCMMIPAAVCRKLAWRNGDHVVITIDESQGTECGAIRVVGIEHVLRDPYTAAQAVQLKKSAVRQLADKVAPVAANGRTPNDG
jgi:hypothetical protein